ncbi:MAG: hypothetical protein RBQ99_06240 [Trichlorobacter sp.]|nr:hypothetical protein [Trichlorobacter sp.]
MALRTHTSDPVPFVIYCPNNQTSNGADSYNEVSAKNSGLLIKEGHKLMEMLLG